ncbi:MAG: DUF452 family protein [Alistipes sp.]|nr:DUF452 family protein [Alistipes sp.]
MQYDWLTREGHDTLLLWMLGWGAPSEVVASIRIPDCDRLCVGDYRRLEALPETSYLAYRRIILCGWSFGVWAAEQVCREVPITAALAFNGTPFPVDERYGISPRVMQLTLAGLRRTQSDESFNRRTYAEAYPALREALAIRPFAERLDELEVLSARASQPYVPQLPWNFALVGTEDRIFPAAHQQAYWGDRARCEALPHYPFADPTYAQSLIEKFL